MAFKLTDTDISILKELLKDGRKSFRQISHDTGISTPTVKASFDRLVNIGFIKSVSSILNFQKVDYSYNLAVNNIMLPSSTRLKTKVESKRDGYPTKLRRPYFRQASCTQICEL